MANSETAPQPGAPEITYTREDRNIINEAVFLRSVLQAEGWAHVVKILDSIVDEARDKLLQYKGTDDHETATLAFIWKTLRAHKEKLEATIKSRIEEGEQLALSKLAPHLQEQPESDSATAFPVVIPACDAHGE